jgi:hypothetical protein
MLLSRVRNIQIIIPIIKQFRVEGAMMVTEGKLEELIKEKRAFLRAAVKDYSAGGNDMLDDVGALLEEAKAELTHNLELASCVKEDEGEAAWRKECLSTYAAWFEKWFGTP